MKKIETKITINASNEKVWNTLVDFKNYEKWNPFITRITGKPEVHEKLEVTLQMQEKKPMQFKPRVLKSKKLNEFRWLGHLYFSGLFDGEHYFVLKRISEEQTEFVHGEKFSGILVNLILKMIGKDTKQAFTMMNKSLKNHVENNA